MGSRPSDDAPTVPEGLARVGSGTNPREPASKAAEAAMGTADERLGGTWWALRVSLGVAILLAGIDKFFDALTTWSMYLSPLAERLIPVSGDTFLRGAGIVEMLIGVAILTRWTRAGAYALAAWMLATSANLAVARNFWDLVLRDVELAIAAFALARLTEWRAASAAGGAARSDPPDAAAAEGSRRG